MSLLLMMVWFESSASLIWYSPSLVSFDKKKKKKKKRNSQRVEWLMSTVSSSLSVRYIGLSRSLTNSQQQVARLFLIKVNSLSLSFFLQKGTHENLERQPVVVVVLIFFFFLIIKFCTLKRKKKSIQRKRPIRGKR